MFVHAAGWGRGGLALILLNDNLCGSGGALVKAPLGLVIRRVTSASWSLLFDPPRLCTSDVARIGERRSKSDRITASAITVVPRLHSPANQRQSRVVGGG